MTEIVAVVGSAENAPSPQIAALHQVLGRLGYKIEESETQNSAAGPSTVRAVRHFQRHFGLRIDEEWLVDAATANVLNQEIAKPVPIMTVGDELFSVFGVVSDLEGVPMVSAEVIAYDQELRDRRELGRAVTDGRGRYFLAYSSDRFRRAEKGYVDLVVVVASAQGVSKPGPLYASEIVFNAPPQFTLNITLDVRGAPEFVRIERAIHPLLSATNVAVDEIDDTDTYKDVTFLAGETGIDAAVIADFAVAARLAKHTKLDAGPLYALLRMDVWPDREFGNLPRSSQLDDRAKAVEARFPSVSGADLNAALAGAVNANIITLESDQRQTFVASFVDYAAKNVELLIHPFGLPIARVADLAQVPLEVAQAIAQSASVTEMHELLASLRNDGKPKEALDKLEGVAQVAKLTLGHVNLTRALTSRVASIDDVRRLALLDKDQWAELLHASLQDSELPTFTGTGDTASRRAEYADFLAARFRNAYPTMAFLGDAGRDAARLVGITALVQLVEAEPAFDLANISIERYLATPSARNPIRSAEQRDDIAKQLKPLQRLYKLSSNYPVTKALAEAGFGSAQEVYRRGKAQVVKLITSQTSTSLRQAELVYDRASATYAATLQIGMEFAAINSGSNLNAMPRTSPPSPGSPVVPLPDIQGLFRIGNDCACEDCRSVTSPAAYLTDLLLFLKNRLVEGGRWAKDVLLDRRPDLVWIDLDCGNALTELPYVDICCEVLEDAVIPFIVATLAPVAAHDMPDALRATISTNFRNALAGAKPPINVSAQATVSAKVGDSWVLRDGQTTYRVQDRGADFGVFILRNTHGTAAERAIVPEYVNQNAYLILATKTYPWMLPLDLPGTEVRESLARIGLPKFELMRLLRGRAPPNNPTDVEIAAARLGVSPAIATLLSTSSPTPEVHWGFSSLADAVKQLTVVSGFLKASGIDYEQLLCLLATPYANPGGALSIQHLDVSCNLNNKNIQTLDSTSLDRLHRFLRLTNVLGLEIPDAAMLVSRIGEGMDTADKFVRVADAMTVRDKLGDLRISELVTLFGDMPTDDIFDQLYQPLLPSLYKSLFLDPAVSDAAFAVSLVASAGPFELISKHRGPILAALSLTSEELDSLLALVNPVTTKPFVGADLSIANVSALFRHKRVTDALNLSLGDWCAYVRMGRVDPFASPRALLDTIERIQKAQALPFDAPTLSYILEADRTSSAAPPEPAIGAALDGLRTTLQQIDVSTDPANLPTDHVNLANALAPALLPLDGDASRAARVLDVLEGRFLARFTPSPKPKAAPVPDKVVGTLPFTAIDDGTDLVLSFTGLMTPSEMTILKDTAHMGPIAGDQAYLAAIDKLYLEPRLTIRMISTRFVTILAVLPSGLSVPQSLRSILTYDPVAKTLQFQGVMSDGQKQKLLSLSTEANYQAAVAALYDAPRAGVLPVSNVWLTDAELQFPAPLPAPKETPAQTDDRVTANLTKAITKILPSARLAASREAVIAYGVSVSGLDRDTTASLLEGLSINGASQTNRSIWLLLLRLQGGYFRVPWVPRLP
jgi:peptidoglycan hydrolase-like protein with peptidoglycan-binding domain